MAHVNEGNSRLVSQRAVGTPPTFRVNLARACSDQHRLVSANVCFILQDCSKFTHKLSMRLTCRKFVSEGHCSWTPVRSSSCDKQSTNLMSSFNKRTHFPKSCDSRTRIIWFGPVAMLIESENWIAKTIFQGFFLFVECLRVVRCKHCSLSQ